MTEIQRGDWRAFLSLCIHGHVDFKDYVYIFRGFPGGTVLKNLPAGDAGDLGLIPGWGRTTGGENGSPLQYSCLENPMDRGAWWATVHGVTVGHDGRDIAQCT